MTKYRIVADTARTFALQNIATGQNEQDGFASRRQAIATFEMHFGWRKADDILGEFKLEN
jgi:hypothetical protein